jgi:hypothetical protein
MAESEYDISVLIPFSVVTISPCKNEPINGHALESGKLTPALQLKHCAYINMIVYDLTLT